MLCHKCGGKKLKFGKSVSLTRGVGATFSYWYKCMGCKHFRFLPRNAANYEYVKDVPWKKTKSARKGVRPTTI